MNPSWQLWQFLVAATVAHGGDGSSLLVSPAWKELADKFEQYDNDSERWWTPTKHDDHVIFANQQECIVVKPPPTGDTAGFECIVEYHWDMDE